MYRERESERPSHCMHALPCLFSCGLASLNIVMASRQQHKLCSGTLSGFAELSLAVFRARAPASVMIFSGRGPPRPSCSPCYTGNFASQEFCTFRRSFRRSFAENCGDCRLFLVRRPTSFAEICGDDDSARKQEESQNPC